MFNISSLTGPMGQASCSPLIILVGLAVPLASTGQLSDDAIDRLVAEVGPDRILCALDRVTSPELPLQAARG
jgi:hypothetical protein